MSQELDPSLIAQSDAAIENNIMTRRHFTRAGTMFGAAAASLAGVAKYSSDASKPAHTPKTESFSAEQNDPTLLELLEQAKGRKLSSEEVANTRLSQINHLLAKHPSGIEQGDLENSQEYFIGMGIVAAAAAAIGAGAGAATGNFLADTGAAWSNATDEEKAAFRWMAEQVEGAKQGESLIAATDPKRVEINARNLAEGLRENWQLRQTILEQYEAQVQSEARGR